MTAPINLTQLRERATERLNVEKDCDYLLTWHRRRWLKSLMPRTYAHLEDTLTHYTT